MRLSLIMRRPVHEVMTWPLWVTRVYAEFLGREPLPEERIELGLAQLTANYVAVHRAPGSPAPRAADFLLARDAWRRLRRDWAAMAALATLLVVCFLAAVTPLLAPVLDVALPDASFYLWAGVPAAWGGCDTDFARELLAQYNVTVLPGSYLAREAQGFNPGAGRIRMALVAETAECLEAAHRIAEFVSSRTA